MRLLFLCLTLFVLVACADQPINGDRSTLVGAARLMSNESGLSVWKIIGSDKLHRNRGGEFFKEVVIYSKPRSVGASLCKAEVYIFYAFSTSKETRWEMIDIDGRGYSTIAASVLENASSELCIQLPIGQYFDAHDPIEDETLIALYSSLVQQLKSGLAENIDQDNFKIRSINLSLRPGFIGSYKYSASVETGVPKRLLNVEIELDSAKFSLRD